MDSRNKTNVMRIAEAQGVPYRSMSYDVEDGNFDGNLTAQKLHLDPDSVFKTLVCVDDKGGHIVCCIPVSRELDLKKAARASGSPSIALAFRLAAWLARWKGRSSEAGLPAEGVL